MNSHPQKLWVVVADQSQARMIEITGGDGSPPVGPPGGRGVTDYSQSPRGHEQARLVNTEPEQERGRPTMADAMGHTISPGNNTEERVRRFAKEITQWLVNQVDNSSVGPMTLFAPPKMLGLFRELLPKEGLAGIGLKEGELMYLTVAQIATHPEVAALLGHQS